jgi:hypothetical protein
MFSYINQKFRQVYFLSVSCLAYYSNVNMEATYSSETSVDFQRTSRFYIPRDMTCFNIVGCNKILRIIHVRNKLCMFICSSFYLPLSDRKLNKHFIWLLSWYFTCCRRVTELKLDTMFLRPRQFTIERHWCRCHSCSSHRLLVQQAKKSVTYKYKVIRHVGSYVGMN